MEKETIAQQLKELFENNPVRERKIVLHTGAAGYEIFQECMEKELGFERVYIGKKVPRILRTLRAPIKKSITGKYYKLIGKRNGKVFSDGKWGIG